MSSARQVTCRMKEYIQPFEQVLALRELEQLAGDSPQAIGAASGTSHLLFQVTTQLSAKDLAHRLAYWETVGDPEEILTSQIRFEASTVVRQSRSARPTECSVAADSFVRPNRRMLRYATHGIHEYRGKFFPQLVRAFINDAKMAPDGIIADPMCGSGTTLVETAIGARPALGLDMNPLSVFVSKVKCKLLSESADALERACEYVRAKLQRHLSASLPEISHFRSLPKDDQVYLERWFSEGALRGLDAVVTAVGQIDQTSIRDFHRVAISNILRRVSWQKEDDLRVRKELKRVSHIDVVRAFIKEIERTTLLVSSFLRQFDGSSVGGVEVAEGDAKRTSAIWSKYKGEIGAVITSPPYATALPYIDTDRLSLAYLGLLTRTEHRKRDLSMIGNREVTEKQRKNYWDRFEKEGSKLPQPTCDLIQRIEDLNSKSDVGFRRRNLAALLSHYFLDMRHVLAEIQEVLMSGGRAYFVVGNNNTSAGEKLIEIETASHLAMIGRSVGLRVQDRIDMDMLTSRDIFRKNTMASEQIIIFSKERH